MPLDPIYLSVSGIDRLAGCENRWVQQHLQDPETAPQITADYFELGSLWGHLKNAWWERRDWVQELLRLAAEDGWEPGFDLQRVYRKGAWMMARFISVHGTEPPYVSVASELPFDLPLLAGSKREPEVRVRGYLDGVVRTKRGGRFGGQHWLREEKTMARWGRDGMVDFDPQLGLYLWAARTLFPIEGLIFDAASTYEYKAKDDTPAQSFKRIERTYDEMAHTVSVARENAMRAGYRARALVRNPDLAVKHVTDRCDRCPFFRGCLIPEDS